MNISPFSSRLRVKCVSRISSRIPVHELFARREKNKNIRIRQWEETRWKIEKLFVRGWKNRNLQAEVGDARPPKTQNCEISLARTTLDFVST